MVAVSPTTIVRTAPGFARNTPATAIPSLPLTPRLSKAPPKPGRYPGVSFDEYQRWAAVSNTMMGKVLASPFHCEQWMHTLDDDEKRHYIDGRAFHMALLEPERFRSMLLILPEINKRSSTQREDRERLITQHPNRFCLDHDAVDKLSTQVRACQRHQRIAELLAVPGECEVCYVWNDAITGLPCKARIDKEVGAIALADFKTARSAAPGAFSRAINDYGYHRQAHHYLTGAAAVGHAKPDYLLGVVEEIDGDTDLDKGGRPPTALAVAYRLGEASRKIGYASCVEALNLIAACLRDGVWPGYSDGDIMDIDIPAWAMGRFADGE